MDPRFLGLVIAVALAGLLSVLAPSTIAEGAGCGIEPIKPIPPIGCKDLIARCQCVRTNQGMVCQWVWDCVPSE